MKAEIGTKYSDLLTGYGRSPRLYKNGYGSGIKSSRSVLSNIGNSDKDSISGRSKRNRTRQEEII